MSHKFFAIMLALIPLSGGAADTLLLSDKVMVMMPGVHAGQLNQANKQVSLFNDRWQLIIVGPTKKVHGTLAWWGEVLPRYWEQSLEIALCPAGTKPMVWQRAKVGQVAVDTIVPLGARFDCWVRTAASSQGWLLFTTDRPLRQPQWRGFMIKNLKDTLEWASRALQVADHRGDKLPWISMKDGIPSLSPNATAELYLKRPPGIPDSSLEYRLHVAGDSLAKPGWQRTGHLLRLTTLSPGKLHQLDVRYQSMPAFSSIQVMVAPNWYQQPGWVALAVLLTCLVAGLPLYLRYRRKLRKTIAQREALEDQLRRLEVQLSPHFLYNALTSIAGLVSMEKYEESITYLTQFGHLLRETISLYNRDLPYTLDDELRMLQSYCRLEQLRFGFAFDISIDEALDPPEVMLPPMLVQPLFENAIRHGAMARGADGRITIRYEQRNKDFLIRVEDNGLGLKPVTSNAGMGLGLALTRQRIESLRKLYDTDIRFSLNREGDKTVATIHFAEWFD